MSNLSKCVNPRDMTERWRKLWRRHAAGWMAGDGDWPQSWTIRAPTEAEARADFDGTRQWIDVWRTWAKKHDAISALRWETRQWRGLGTQELPTRVECASPEQLAGWIGEDTAWRRATERFARLTARRPAMGPMLRKYFTTLAHDDEIDQQRVESVLDWLLAHPASGLYPRQLPIAGLDTKWLNAGRKRQLRDWLRQARGEMGADVLTAIEEDETTVPTVESVSADAAFIDTGMIGDAGDNSDFYTVSGLRAEPSFLCLRALDPRLRREVGGLSLLQASPEEAARLTWAVRSVLIVENLTTGWALEDLPDTVAIVGRGYAVGALAGLPWMCAARVGYWGDIDTHGFGILSSFRTSFPRSQSRKRPVIPTL